MRNSWGRSTHYVVFNMPVIACGAEPALTGLCKKYIKCCFWPTPVQLKETGPKTKGMTKDTYIPLKDRFNAWWEDQQPEAANGERQPIGAAAIQVAARRLAAADGADVCHTEFLRHVFGAQDGVLAPGGFSWMADMLAPVPLTNRHRLLVLGCGFGGGLDRLYHDIGLRIDGIEQDDTLVAEANAYLYRRGAANAVDVTQGDPAAPWIEKERYFCTYAREQFFRSKDKESLFEAIHAGLIRGGHLAFTDLVLADPYATGDAAVEKWLAAEAGNAVPVTAEDHFDQLERLGFDVQIVEDWSARYRDATVGGWSSFVADVPRDVLSRPFVDGMMHEAEYWLTRMRALSSRRVKLIRIHAVKVIG